MSDYTVQLDGTEELLRTLGRINADIRGEVALKAVHAGGIQIENKARINAPVLTGALRNSVTTIAKQTGSGAEAEIGFRGLVYARIQEFGGRAGRNRMTVIRGKHYLERAIESEKGRAVDAMSAVVRASLEKQ